MKKVLIAVDETEGSKAVLSVFKNMVRPTESVVLVHVQHLEGKSMMIDMLSDSELDTHGEKAAVSLQLTKLGSKILWQSFETPTPDVSFSFEMEVTGFRSPKRALIEANFDQIYEHQAFAVGLASSYLSAEIKGAFDDLRRSGAIKLTQVGEDKDLDALITTAYNKIAEMMFSPLNGTGTPSLDSLAGGAVGGSSVLDRATKQLEESRKEAATDNEAIKKDNEAARGRNEKLHEADAKAASARAKAGEPSERRRAFHRHAHSADPGCTTARLWHIHNR